MKLQRYIHGLIVVAATACLLGMSNPAVADASLVREQKTVVINGVRETWRLEWQATPLSVCGADDVETALACPCSGFAYGEAGKLSLVRARPGATAERLELTPHFKGNEVPGAGGLAVLQRWRPIPAMIHSEDDDWRHASDFNFLKRVQARAPSELMRIADYNHDGRASEFLLQLGNKPCGKHMLVLVGVSRFNPQLHLFASAEAPDTPLVLGSRAWEAVRKSIKPGRVVEWSCADHTSAVESTVTVAVHGGVFHVQREDRPCPQEGFEDDDR